MEMLLSTSHASDHNPQENGHHSSWDHPCEAKRGAAYLLLRIKNNTRTSPKMAHNHVCSCGLREDQLIASRCAATRHAFCNKRRSEKEDSNNPAEQKLHHSDGLRISNQPESETILSFLQSCKEVMKLSRAPRCAKLHFEIMISRNKIAVRRKCREEPSRATRSADTSEEFLNGHVCVLLCSAIWHRVRSAY